MPSPSLDNPPSIELFRIVQQVEQEDLRVDRKSGRINGVAVIQKGELTTGDSRAMFVDDTTLDQVVEFGNQPNKGHKVRYTHPNMSNDGLGTQVGKIANFRRDGDVVRADIQLSEAARTSPKGNLYDHLLDMAEEWPEDFGMSVAAKGLDRQRMKNEKRMGDGFQPIRFLGLRAVDFVESPAATKGGLFSVEIPEIDVKDVPFFATQILDQLFPGATADTLRTRVSGFLDRYFANRFGSSFFQENDVTTNTEQTPATDDAKTGQTGSEAKTETTSETKTEATGSETKTEPAKESGSGSGNLSVEDKAKLAERDRVKKIRAIGETFGASDKDINTLIDNDFSIEEARGILSDKFAKREQIAGLNDGPDVTETKKETPEEKFGKEYDESQHQFDVSREDYIESRMIDEGLKPLAVGSKAKQS